MTERTTDMEAWALLEEHRQRVAMVERLTSQPVWTTRRLMTLVSILRRSGVLADFTDAGGRSYRDRSRSETSRA